MGLIGAFFQMVSKCYVHMSMHVAFRYHTDIHTHMYIDIGKFLSLCMVRAAPPRFLIAINITKVIS